MMAIWFAESAWSRYNARSADPLQIARLFKVSATYGWKPGRRPHRGPGGHRVARLRLDRPFRTRGAHRVCKTSHIRYEVGATSVSPGNGGTIGDGARSRDACS
jgi:hypothetical protein